MPRRRRCPARRWRRPKFLPGQWAVEEASAGHWCQPGPGHCRAATHRGIFGDMSGADVIDADVAEVWAFPGCVCVLRRANSLESSLFHASCGLMGATCPSWCDCQWVGEALKQLKRGFNQTGPAPPGPSLLGPGEAAFGPSPVAAFTAFCLPVI